MEELCTLKELSKYLKSSKPTIHKMVEQGKIASQWRFKRGGIDSWFEKQRKQ